MSDDSDNALRRSKRNKFHLDVAAIHNGRSRSPALQHLVIHSSPSPSQLVRPRPSPSAPPIAPIVPITPPMIIARIPPKPEYFLHKSQIPHIAVPNLGKRKRTKVVCDDYSYDSDSDGVPIRCESADASEIRYENEYPCPRCPAQFESRVGLTNHLKLHGANKMFPCGNCDFSCTNRKTMRQHRRVHGQQNPTRKRKSVDQKKLSMLSSDGGNDGRRPKRCFPCPWCPFKTRTFARLIPHKLGHFRAYGYQCPHCSFRASSSLFLLNHISLHGKSVPKSEVLVHVLTEDADQDPVPTGLNRSKFPLEHPILSCEKCNYQTRQRFSFQLHQKKHCKKSGKLEKKEPHIQAILDNCDKSKVCQRNKFCGRCGRRFLTFGEYLIHFHRKHFPNRRSQRPNCREMLQERMGKPEYLSSLESTNKDPTDLLRHVAALGPQSMIGELVVGASSTFTCTECPYKTISQAKLASHELKHQIKSEHQCSQCNYSCKTSESIMKHLNLHEVTAVPINEEFFDPSKDESGPSSPSKKLEASLRCPHCPYRSKHGCDMKAHQKMHSDRGTFRCPYCTYSTMRLNALKTHTTLHEQETGHIVTDNATPTPDQPMVQKLPEKEKESDFLPKEVVIKKLWNETRQQILGKKIMKTSGKTVYRCINCPFECRFPSMLNQHAKHHSKPSKYKCPKCNFSSSSTKEMVQVPHPGDLCLSCQTAQNDALPSHIDIHQNEPAPEGGWFCSVCPYRADSYGKQWHHVQKHKKVGRFNCDICKFGVGSIQSFNDHMALHGILPGNSATPTVVETTKQASIESCSVTTTTDISSTITGPRTPEGSSSEKDKSEERSTTSSLPGVALAQDFEMDMDWSGASTITPSASKRSILEEEWTSSSPTNSKRTSSPATCGPVTRNKKPTPQKKQAFVRPPPANGPYKNNIQLDLPPIPAVIKPKRKRQFSGSSTGNSNDVDDEEKLHECKHCPFTCLDSQMLKFHTRMHIGDRPQKCAMCTFSCFNIDALYAHMNVHAPQLPEAMLATMKKKLAQKRRNGGIHERETLPINATNVFRCQQCSFRTAYQDRFLQHRMEHVQHLQQRLMTQMKRAANDEKDGRKAKLLARKKADRKWNYCSQCSFRSDTVVALMNHQEFHGNRNNVFTCRYCNYSANNSDVVVYHENTHHMDLPATNQVLNLVAVNGVVDSDLLSERRQKYSCYKCPFICHELADFISHFEGQHMDDPQLQEVVEKLRMGLFPTLPIRNNQSCQAAVAQEQKSSDIVATAAEL